MWFDSIHQFIKQLKMIDFSLSDEQKFLIEAVRTFIKTELAPHEQIIEDTGVLAPEIATQIHAKSKELGFGISR